MNTNRKRVPARARRLAALAIPFLLALLLMQTAAVQADGVQPAQSAGGAAPSEDSGEATEGAGLVCVAENSGRRLLLNLDTTDLVVEAADGVAFHAFPQGEDAEASGSVRNDMKSLLLVSYIDEQNSEFWVSSAVGSVRRQSYSIKKLSNGKGAVIEFQFSREKEQFTIPLRLTLEEGALRAEVQFDKLKESGTARVTGVKLLPYLLAGRSGEEGYVLVPDGSGMAIAFDEKVPGTFSQKVYGADPALTKRTQTGVQQTVQMPVIGMERESRAVVGIIERGDTDASIEAQSPGVDSSYAWVCPAFTYRQMDVSVLADSAWNEREVTVVSEKTASVNPEVTYHFLDGTQAQPAGMAAVYRDYLLDKEMVRQSVPDGPLPCSFEVFGAVAKAGTFLGIPVSRTVSATTCTQLESMMKAFRDRGVVASQWTLYGFTKGGLYGNRLGETAIDSAVGGTGAYQTLLKNAGAQGAAILLGVDLQNLYRQSFRYSFISTPVKQLSGDNAYQYFFKRNLPSRDKGFHWLLVKPGKLPEAGRDFLKGYGKIKGAGLALLSAGDSLYADYNASSYADRADTRDALVALGESLKKEAGTVWTTGGNAYSLRYAGGILNAPSQSSGYEYASWDIPFYQLVFHGLLPMAAVPANAADGELWEQELRNMETGMLPSYRLTGSSPELYRDTRLDFLLNTAYENWLDDCAAQYAQFNAIHRPLAKETIVDYRRFGAVNRVTYADGTAVYVNYSAKDETVDGKTIPARDCLVG